MFLRGGLITTLFSILLAMGMTLVVSRQLYSLMRRVLPLVPSILRCSKSDAQPLGDGQAIGVLGGPVGSGTGVHCATKGEDGAS